MLVSLNPISSSYSKKINHKEKAEIKRTDKRPSFKSVPANTFRAYSLPKITFGNSIPSPAKLPELYSIVFQTNPHLEKVHKSVLAKCAEKGWTNDSPELARWLADRFKQEDKLSWVKHSVAKAPMRLLQLVQIKLLGKKLPLLKFLEPKVQPDKNKDGTIKTSSEENCNYAEALAVYSCSIMERQLRRACLKVAPSSKKKEYAEYGDMLGRLSNIYRAKYRLHTDRPFYLEVAHSLAVKSAENYRPKRDEPCYVQTNDHRLHLFVSVPSEEFVHNEKFRKTKHCKEKEKKFDNWEETLKLCLAFNQMEAGSPHNEYAPHLLRDLVNLYDMKGDEQSRKMYSDYAGKVVPIKQEPELWYDEHCRPKH